ncbi:hypothetical protein BKA70DRAFT_1237287 [Coprinopsis sp. MPI-PUGE-AT-0042]|nr:hypothetical protein BKA70DRAFT_1237287 [Coprinopsis sp. MPI-PUGE-AT-0042]
MGIATAILDAIFDKGEMEGDDLPIIYPDRPWHWVVVNGIPIKNVDLEEDNVKLRIQEELADWNRVRLIDIDFISVAIPVQNAQDTACSGKTVQLYITRRVTFDRPTQAVFK